jgi:hypothetical protein
MVFSVRPLTGETMKRLCRRPSRAKKTMRSPSGDQASSGPLEGSMSYLMYW